MTPDKAREVLAIYRKKFEEMDMPNIEFLKGESIAFSALPDIEALSHCNSMLDEIELLIKMDRMRETHRLLGFIQGALWRSGIYTLEEIAEQNRMLDSQNCPECGAPPNQHEMRDLNTVAREADIYCTKCQAFVRMWDP